MSNMTFATCTEPVKLGQSITVAPEPHVGHLSANKSHNKHCMFLHDFVYINTSANNLLT